MDVVSDSPRERERTESGPWKPPPLELVVCEPLEDEARRSASQKDDVELAELYAIAHRAHSAATDGGDRAGEVDYWDVLQRAIVEEAARRPEFGQAALAADEPGRRRERRRRRKHLEALTAAREAELSGPTAAS